MSTRDQLLLEAEEAERMAELVSYGVDKTRLREKAAELRRRAEALDETPPPEPPPKKAPGVRRPRIPLPGRRR